MRRPHPNIIFWLLWTLVWLLAAVQANCQTWHVSSWIRGITKPGTDLVEWSEPVSTDFTFELRGDTLEASYGPVYIRTGRVLSEDDSNTTAKAWKALYINGPRREPRDIVLLTYKGSERQFLSVYGDGQVRTYRLDQVAGPPVK